jgi:O-antigen/teichoic acid export membrane protein
MIILARLLLPSDFGLLGMALTLIGGAHAFTITGIRAALIQRKQIDDCTLNTAWMIQVARGGLLFLILAASAPFASRFFDEPELTAIIRLLALNHLFSGCRSVGLFLLEKELDFRRRAGFEMIASVLTTGAAITVAFWLQNVWALVIGEVSGGIIRLVLSYRAHPFRPRLQFSSRAARELFGYGQHILLVRIILYLLYRGDDLIVGKMLGPASLGFYSLAYQLANLPATSIAHPASNVTLPAYAKLQDDADAVRAGYLRTVRVVASVSVPATLALFVFAPQIIQVVYGGKWLPMMWPMRILCLFGWVRAINITFGSLFQGTGHVQFLRNYAFYQFIWFGVTAYPAAVWRGLEGIALTVSCGGLLHLAFCVLRARRLIQLKIGGFLRTLSGALLAGSIASGLGLALTETLNVREPAFLAFALVAYSVTYLLSLWLIDRAVFLEAKLLRRR